MNEVVFVSLALPACALLILAAWRWIDKQADLATWATLLSRQPINPAAFDAAMVAELPGPARRYFDFTIRQGTPLYTVAEISMRGELSLGSKARPNYMPMQAEQILAAPFGFVWKLVAGSSISVSGSDAAINSSSWSRFWLLGTVPVARTGANMDHARSAFGRCIAEALIWTPAAMLPGDNVAWNTAAAATARVTVTHMDLQQSVDVTVDAAGRPTKVAFSRWSDANPAKVFRLQPFGGYLSDFKDFDGYRLPTRIEAGNFFATDDYFPFFRVCVTSIRFPGTRSE
jgi:hypothetical protein